jgi:hypothetical protein
MTDDTSLIEPSALRDLGSRLADILDSDHFNNVEAAFLLPALQELREARARIAELERELVDAHERINARGVAVDHALGRRIEALCILRATAERERDAALRENAELREAIAIRCEQIREFVLWLDQYQPDVWERGLWSAHNAAIDAAREREKAGE